MPPCHQSYYCALICHRTNPLCSADITNTVKDKVRNTDTAGGLIGYKFRKGTVIRPGPNDSTRNMRLADIEIKGVQFVHVATVDDGSLSRDIVHAIAFADAPIIPPLLAMPCRRVIVRLSAKHAYAHVNLSVPPLAVALPAKKLSDTEKVSENVKRAEQCCLNL